MTAPAKHVPNPNGHPEPLKPFQPGNEANLRHGLHSTKPQELLPEDEEFVQGLLSLPHAIPADRAAAETVALLRRQFLHVSARLAHGKVENARGVPRRLRG